ncbi:amino acid ABC transporter substrate-binding protein [Terrihabitans soli]|uniref:Amino acid ABC transporter substrate-binding protein n=1 Tax=Terrihabitans soli TaxID=708113 RepID=A0A6S6QYA7_9HYPH|nr:transporter substrate-binding domain-containing protein [Terrihabitans soli]BCJ91558.1 amino acid ABC transporter substrate-binding protein [Terrihabitans soli]
MKFTVIAAAALAALSVTAASAQTTLKIGSEGAYPPFNTKDTAGNVVGFDIDIAQAMCAEMKVTCTVVTQDWDGMIPALVNKKFDFVSASMSITEERQKVVNFTDPYYSNKLQFVAKKGTELSVKPEDLKKKIIGAQRATIAAEWIEKNIGAGTNVKLYDTQENAWLDLEAGRTDAVLADAFLSYDWLQSPTGKNFEFKDKPVFDDDKIGMAVRKEDKELLAKLNAALKKVIESGTYDTINKKYFPFSIR